MFDLSITLIANGLLLSGIYLLVSLGLSLIFGVMNVVNFAHGGIIMAGGYLTYWLYRDFSVDPLLSLLLVIPLMFVLGYALQIYLVERVIDEDELFSLLMTFGIFLVLQAIFRLIFSTKSLSMQYLSAPIQFGGISLSTTRVITGVIGFLLAGLLFVFLNRSRQGQAIRATSQAPRLAEASGIDSRQIRGLTFGLGSVLAGVGGTAYFLAYSISPIGGQNLLLIGFVVVVLGGMGSLTGTVVASFIVGLVYTFGQYIIGSIETQMILFMSIVLILLIRPYGLFGEPEGRLYE